MLACSNSTVLLRADDNNLQRALGELPIKSQVNAVVELKIIASPALYVDATNPEPKVVRFDLKYPASEMLNIIGGSIVDRRFNREGENIKSLKLEMEIKKLFYNHINEIFKIAPVIQAVVRIKAVDSQGRLLMEGDYSAKVVGGFFSMLVEDNEIMAKHYGYAAYKALLIAFDNAIDDLQNTINKSISAATVD